MIAGVLLAAGRASRFGGAKLMTPLADLDGVVGAVACRALVAALPRTVAVVRPGDRELAAVLRFEGADVVECPDADQGMGRSLAFGIAAVADAAGWVIALADMPWVRSSTVRAVADAVGAGAAVAVPCHHGVQGHPVGFGRACLPALLELAGDEGAKRIVAAWGESVHRFDVDDPGCLRDVDRPADLDFGGTGQR